MKRGVANGNAADFDRLNLRHRRQAVLAEAPFDLQQFAFAPDAAELKSNLPPRVMRRRPQRNAVGRVRQLDHDSVHRIRQILDFGGYFMPALFQLPERKLVTELAVIHQRQPGALPEHVRDVFQPHDSGDGIAGIFVRTAAFFGDPGIQVFKVVVADHDFTARRAVQRSPVIGAFQLDQRQFVGNILAGHAVAAGGEHPAVEISRNTVVLRLDQ